MYSAPKEVLKYLSPSDNKEYYFIIDYMDGNNKPELNKDKKYQCSF